MNIKQVLPPPNFWCPVQVEKIKKLCKQYITTDNTGETSDLDCPHADMGCKDPHWHVQNLFYITSSLDDYIL